MLADSWLGKELVCLCRVDELILNETALACPWKFVTEAIDIRGGGGRP